MLSHLLGSSSPARGAGLSVGDEVDYNVADGFWVPARVERVDENGHGLVLRFAVGSNDLQHRVDLSRAGDARRIAAACESAAAQTGGRGGRAPSRARARCAPPSRVSPDAEHEGANASFSPSHPSPPPIPSSPTPTQACGPSLS
jgi:hypothetical protein